MYKLFIAPSEQKFVINTETNACIPFDPDNTDYQVFLKYQAEGGVVLPADDNEQTA
jgi:hypothetical protein